MEGEFLFLISMNSTYFSVTVHLPIDIEYNKSLDCQWPCLEDDLNGGSNNIVQSNKSV